MKYLIGITILFLLIGCSPGYNSSFTYEEEFESLEDVFYWVYCEIRYVSDGPDILDDYWQSAQETYNLRTGDCEDMAIIFIEFAKDMGYEPNFIAPPLHALAECDGTYYDPAMGSISETRDSGPALKLNYKELMWIMNN